MGGGESSVGLFYFLILSDISDSGMPEVTKVLFDISSWYRYNRKDGLSAIEYDACIGEGVLAKYLSKKGGAVLPR